MNLHCLLKGEISQNELFNYYNVCIIYEELPKRINGFVFNKDDVNFIVINKYLSYYKRKKTILHELAHIELNHLYYRDKDLFAFYVNKFEDEADRYIKFLIETC